MNLDVSLINLTIPNVSFIGQYSSLFSTLYPLECKTVVLILLSEFVFDLVDDIRVNLSTSLKQVLW